MAKVSIDYRRVDWRFVSKILKENTLRLSRTRQGKSDTGSGWKKEPLLLSGEPLKEKVIHNEEVVYQSVYRAHSEAIPKSGDGVKQILFTIADMTNEGLLSKGRFRTWEIHANQKSLSGGEAVCGPEAKVSPEELPQAVADFCSEVSRRWDELGRDPVPLAAWAERQLNGGPLHPFYDGCGRISRALAAYLLIAGGHLLPLYDDSQSYFAHCNEGIETFTAYVRRSINRCAEWIKDGPQPL
ncbi:hypothetical protein ACFL5Z_07660 [Planctomycetota bacterium]